MNTNFEQFIAPFKALNEVAVANVEKLAGLQLKAFEENTKVGLEQLKNAAAISDLDGLKDYLSTQAEVTRQVAERSAKDARTFVELGNHYNTELQRIVKEGFSAN